MRHRWVLKIGALATALLVITACSPEQQTSWLLLGGDVMLARGGEPIFTAASPWAELSQYLSEAEADLFSVNLESPFGSIDQDYDSGDLDTNLCAGESMVAILQQAGVDVVTTANNHASDCTPSNTFNTRNTVEKARIQALDETQGMLYVPVGEQTVAILNINDYSGEYNIASDMAELSIARQKSDLVVVSIHWGNEYQAGPSRDQEILAQELVDAGADLVWGHHPHVLQRMDWMTSNIDGHRALVIYSLGNLLSDQWMLPDAMRTALIRIEFVDHQVRKIAIIPLQMEAQRKVLIYAKDSGKQEILNRLKFDELKDGKGITDICVEGED